MKKIFEGKPEDAHSQFVRFSKGRFENRANLNLWKTNKIKLKGSFEWANDFVEIVAELKDDVKFSGIISSKEQLDLEDEKKKTGIYQYNVKDISAGKIREIKDKVYVMLLNCEEEEIVLKIKKKLPKPGKSKKKNADSKFCQLEADLKYWAQIKEAFMLPECKKCKISHVFEINEIIMPEGEKDFVKIREMAKRKGRIIRKAEVDGSQIIKEIEFEC